MGDRSGRAVGEPLEESQELRFDFRCQIKKLNAEEPRFGPTDDGARDPYRCADMGPLKDQLDRLFDRIASVGLKPTACR